MEDHNCSAWEHGGESLKFVIEQQAPVNLVICTSPEKLLNFLNPLLNMDDEPGMIFKFSGFSGHYKYWESSSNCSTSLHKSGRQLLCIKVFDVLNPYS